MLSHLQPPPALQNRKAWEPRSMAMLSNLREPIATPGCTEDPTTRVTILAWLSMGPAPISDGVTVGPSSLSSITPAVACAGLRPRIRVSIIPSGLAVLGHG